MIMIMLPGDLDKLATAVKFHLTLEFLVFSRMQALV